MPKYLDLEATVVVDSQATLNNEKVQEHNKVIERTFNLEEVHILE